MNTVDMNGAAGGDYLTSAQGAQTSKRYRVIEILEDDTTFSTLTNSLIGGAALTGRSWKRGDRIWGLTTAVMVSAGECLAYQEV